LRADELLQTVLDAIRARTGHEPVQNGEQWQCRCPAHADEAPSLSVAAGDKGVVLRCFAGCTTAEVAAAIGMEVGELFYDHNAKRKLQNTNCKAKKKATRQAARRPLTVAALAAAKGVSAGFLRSLGCREQGDAVVIGYRMMDGKPAARHRLRLAASAKTGSRWTGTKADGDPVPYGLWRLGEARQAGYLVIVEGESDCWALWSNGFPALGVPGSLMTKCLAAEHVAGIEKIYVHREPDKAGSRFARDVVRLVKGFAVNEK